MACPIPLPCQVGTEVDVDHPLAGQLSPETYGGAVPRLILAGLMHPLDPTSLLCKPALAALTTIQETCGKVQPSSAPQHSA